MRWGGIFDIDAKLIEITNEEEKTFAPDFWNNAKEAELIVKNLRSKKKWVDDYNLGIAHADELQLAYEFYKEGELTEAELDAQYALTNSHLEDLEFKIASIVSFQLWSKMMPRGTSACSLITQPIIDSLRTISTCLIICKLTRMLYSSPEANFYEIAQQRIEATRK